MIKNKKDYLLFINEDLKAWGFSEMPILWKRPQAFRFQMLLRKTEYYFNCKPRLLYLFVRQKYNSWCRKLGVSIAPNVIGPGLYMPHPICVVIHSNARVGKFAKIQQGVTIGQTNGSDSCPNIGDYCFVGAGAKIIGGINVASHVAIGANAVVVKSILEPHTTWGGVPAKMISKKGSTPQLNNLW